MQVDVMRRRYWLFGWIGIAIAGPIVLFIASLQISPLFYVGPNVVQFIIAGRSITEEDVTHSLKYVFVVSLLIIWAICVAMPLIVKTPPFWLVATIISVNWLIALAGLIGIIILFILYHVIIQNILIFIIMWAIFSFCIVALSKMLQSLIKHIKDLSSIIRITLAHILVTAVIVGGMVLYHSLLPPPPVKHPEPTWDEIRAALKARPAPALETPNPTQLP